MNIRDTAADIVVLVRRHVALGGSTSTGPVLMNPPPDVLAVVDAVLAKEPRAWSPDRGESVPAIATLSIEGVSVEVWHVENRPAGLPDDWKGGYVASWDASVRAGALLVEIADMAPRRRGRKAA